MSTITKIHARQIYDSRGNPTIEVEVTTQCGTYFAAVPSGASTGAYEAVELRDDVKSEWLGKGVSKAIQNVNSIIAPALVKSGLVATQQKEIDQFMMSLDGTPNKSKLGANAILGVSLAVCRAAAAEKKIPLYKYIAELAGNTQVTLPMPAFNVINGGRHAGNRLAMQEFKILPTGATSFSEAMRMGAEVYQHLKTVIKKRYGQDAINVGDEGGFAPNVSTAKEALTLIVDAIALAGYTGRISIGIDMAASEYHHDNIYDLDFKNVTPNKEMWLTGARLAEYYRELCSQFPIISMEDPFDQDDWSSWSHLTELVSPGLQVIADDLTVTNPQRIKKAIDQKSANCLLLKVNQIGTLTESIEACKMAQKAGWGVMVSHRSGETEDTFIADLSVGLCSGQIKSGAPCRSERLSKYNQLLRIEEELGKKAQFVGKDFRCFKH